MSEQDKIEWLEWRIEQDIKEYKKLLFNNKGLKSKINFRELLEEE